MLVHHLLPCRKYYTTYLDDHIRPLNALHQPLPAPSPPPGASTAPKAVLHRRRDRIHIAHDELYERVDVFRRDSFHPLFKVVNVPVQSVNVELDRGELVDAGRGDAEGLLEAFEDAFAISEGCL